MTNQLSSFRRFPTAFAIVAGSALAFGGLMASTSPAYAQGSADYRCTGLADQANTAADSAQGGKQASAKRFVATGKKLCEAGNERAAAKQFRAALKDNDQFLNAPNAQAKQRGFNDRAQELEQAQLARQQSLDPVADQPGSDQTAPGEAE